MGVQDAIPQGYRRGLTSCPVCGQYDGVVAVPAIYESSRATERAIAEARRVVNDFNSLGTGKAAGRATLAVTTPPPVRSRRLAPAPMSIWGTFLGGAVSLAIPATFLHFMAKASNDFSNTYHMASDPENSTLATIGNCFAGLAALCLLATVVAFVRRGAVTRGRPAADAVWRRGWYCQRCALVHFSPGEEPAGVLTGQVLSPDQFRALVWTVGGYGNRAKPGRS